METWSPEGGRGGGGGGHRPIPHLVGDGGGRVRIQDPALPVLPEELVREILTWLPVKSLMRFKCVSRQWLSTIMEPSFAKEYRGGFRGLLISEQYYHRLAGKRDLFYISLSDSSSSKEEEGKEELSHHVTMDHGGRRMGSTEAINGLICFYDGNYSCLYNVATRESAELPLSKDVGKCCSYHLGFDPVNQVYKLLKICPMYEEYDLAEIDLNDWEQSDSFAGNLDCEILTFGVDASWRSINPSPSEIVSRSVCLGGVLYWAPGIDGMPVDYWVTAFDLAQEMFQLIPMPSNWLGYRLPSFGTYLSLFMVYYIDRPSPKEALLLTLGGKEDDSRSGTSNGEFGAWSAHKFELPQHGNKRNFNPMGILPSGEILLYPGHKEIHCPATFFLYDPTQQGGQFKRVAIHKSPTSSPSSSSIIDRGVHGYASYHHENIIPLASLIIPS